MPGVFWVGEGMRKEYIRFAHLSSVKLKFMVRGIFQLSKLTVFGL